MALTSPITDITIAQPDHEWRLQKGITLVFLGHFFQLLEQQPSFCGLEFHIRNGRAINLARTFLPGINKLDGFAIFGNFESLSYPILETDKYRDEAKRTSSS